MKLRKIVMLLMMIAVVFSITACNNQNGENHFKLESTKQEQDIGKSNEEVPKLDNKNSGEDTEQDVGAFDENADLEGSVYDFTDAGFSLSMADIYEEGEGSVMEQAAPGAEDESSLVLITYADNCTFQIVVMDAASLTEVSNENTTSESIKKQTQVKVYGNCQDTTHWTAEKIIIVRWQ